MELPGNCYAINRGKYTGKFIVFVRKNGRYNEFLVIPGSFKILILDKKDLEKAKEETILDKATDFVVEPYITFVKKLPDEVFEVIKLQFLETEKNKKNFINDLFANRK